MNLVNKIYIKKTSKNDENFYLKLRNKLSNRKISLYEKILSKVNIVNGLQINITKTIIIPVI